MKLYKLQEFEGELFSPTMEGVVGPDCPKCKELQLKGYHYHQGNCQWPIKEGDVLIRGNWPPVVDPEDYLTLSEIKEKINGTLSWSPSG